MEEVDPRVFVNIGRNLCIERIKKNALLENHCAQRYFDTEDIINALFTCTAELADIKNNILEMEDNQKKINISKINKNKNNKNNIEIQKYYYYSVTIDKLKEEQFLLEKKQKELHIIYKSLKYTNLSNT